MTRADSKKLKSGQAMVEFLLGLIGILVIVLSLELIASFVVEDFDVMQDVRAEVARSLVDGVDSSGDVPLLYRSETFFYSGLLNDIKYDRTKELQDTYPPRYEDVNGFDIVAMGNPISDLVGIVASASVPVQTEFLRKALGRDRIRKVNAVWVPPWDDLMGAEEEE
ncbi:MAG: hypothetical protein GXY61_01695 [Lentisphaerae bacterium]|nr:hypothetical protein [Lentisphaerota bacterium]